MTSARDIMTPMAQWIADDATVADAAKVMAEESFGTLPVCDGEGHLQGVVTDRDLVVKVMAVGRDPQRTRVGEVADQDEVVTIGADDPVEEAIATMKRSGVKRNSTVV